MFESRFNFTLEDNISGTMYTTKKKNKELAIVVYILLAICLVMSIVTLVLDIISGASFIFDIFLIIFVIAVGTMYYFSPKFWKKSAIKTYQEYIAPNNYCVVIIDEDSCKVSFFKEQEEVSKMVLDLNNITACFEDEFRLVIVFNKTNFAVVKKDALKGNIQELKDLIEVHLKENETIEYMKKI